MSRCMYLRRLRDGGNELLNEPGPVGGAGPEVVMGPRKLRRRKTGRGSVGSRSKFEKTVGTERGSLTRLIRCSVGG